MAKNGFKIIDAELHVMEPVDLWEKYIDPEFKDRAPRRLSERRWDIRTVVEGDVMASMTDYNWPARSTEEEDSLAARYADEIAANFDPASQVKAMDNEGLDLAVLYPTAGMFITARNGMDPGSPKPLAGPTTTGCTTTFRPATRPACSARRRFRPTTWKPQCWKPGVA